MKIIIAMVLSLLAVPALAQEVNVDTNSNSESTSGASTLTEVNNALTLQTETHRKTEIRTAPGHGMAATTNSFSSDYCGGTTQVGGSGMGWSIGGSKQTFDANCQGLRRAAAFGQQSAHAQNIGMGDTARILTMMAIWEVCRSNPITADGCQSLGLTGTAATPAE